MATANEPISSRDDIDDRLDEALEESFPASDAPSLTQPRPAEMPSADEPRRPPRARHSYPMLLILAGVGWLLSRLARGGSS